MSTNLIIGIVASLAVVGGGTYVAMNPEIIASITGGVANEMEENMENENASVGSTFADLVARGQAVTCTFSHDDGAGNRSSGTVYMTGGATQIRGDFTVESPVASSATFIRTGGYNYIWGPAMPQGVKTKVENETELMEGQEGGIDEDTEFSCQAWTVDSSKFSLPSGIQFTDFSAQVEAAAGASTGVGNVKAQQCAACANLPAGAKEQCLAALAC